MFLHIQISYTKDSPHMLCPGKNAKIDLDSSTIGHVGELNPGLTMDLDLPQNPICFEIYKNNLKLPSQMNYQDHSYFPSSRRDISLLMSENQEISTILTTLS